MWTWQVTSLHLQIRPHRQLFIAAFALVTTVYVCLPGECVWSHTRLPLFEIPPKLRLWQQRSCFWQGQSVGAQLGSSLRYL